MRVLIMGLPGTGKTTLAKALVRRMPGAVHFEADAVRRLYDDWDFSTAGRLRQALRMRALADALEPERIALCDFVCPTAETRAAFGAELTIWMDTERTSGYADTDALFEPPAGCDVVVRCKDAEAVADHVLPQIVTKQCVWREQAPTALLIGRWQPFHDGHLALVREALKRAPQVLIGVRDVHGTLGNPYSFGEVRGRIERALLAEAPGRIRVAALPNIAHVLYGRDVGYNVERVMLAPDVEGISATAVRAAGGQPTPGTAEVERLIGGEAVNDG